MPLVCYTSKACKTVQHLSNRIYYYCYLVETIQLATTTTTTTKTTTKTITTKNNNSSSSNICVFLMSLSVCQHLMTGQRNILATVWSCCHYAVYISTASQVLISHIAVLPSRCSVLHYMHNSEASFPHQLVPHREYIRCSTVSSVPTRTTHRTRCYLNFSYLGVTQVTHSVR